MKIRENNKKNNNKYSYKNRAFALQREEKEDQGGRDDSSTFDSAGSGPKYDYSSNLSFDQKS